jgi:hypothetical protein
MTGYNLKQLLTWCYDDRLIETYSIRDDKVYVQAEGSTTELDPRHAVSFLKGLIRRKSTLPGSSSMRGYHT